jgi:hypothetical protein
MSLNSDEEINTDIEEKGEPVSEETAQDLFWKKATETIGELKEPVVALLKMKLEKPKIPTVADIMNEVMSNLDVLVERKLIQNLIKVGILEPKSLDEFDKANQRNNPKPRAAYDASQAALGDVNVLGKY